MEVFILNIVYFGVLLMFVFWYNKLKCLFYYICVDLYRCLYFVDLIELIFIKIILKNECYLFMWILILYDKYGDWFLVINSWLKYLLYYLKGSVLNRRD